MGRRQLESVHRRDARLVRFGFCYSRDLLDIPKPVRGFEPKYGSWLLPCHLVGHALACSHRALLGLQVGDLRYGLFTSQVMTAVRIITQSY